MINVAVDTNLLVYAEDPAAGEKRVAALDLLETLPRETTLIPVFVLGELFRVLVHKARRPVAIARELVFAWGDSFPLIELSSSVMLAVGRARPELTRLEGLRCCWKRRS